MNPPNKRSPDVKGIHQQPVKQAKAAHQFKPVIAESKSAVAAQGVKRPVVPPVYRPRLKHETLQAKEALKPQGTPATRAGRHALAPVAPMPQRNAKAGTKSATGAPPTPQNPGGMRPQTPAPYRAGAAPAVIQRKTAGLPRHSGGKGVVMSALFRKGVGSSAYVIQRAASSSSSSSSAGGSTGGSASDKKASDTKTTDTKTAGSTTKTTTTGGGTTITDWRSLMHKKNDPYQLSDYELFIKGIVNLKPGAKAIKLANGLHQAFEVWAKAEIGHFDIQFDDDATKYHVYWMDNGWYIIDASGYMVAW